MLELTKAPSVRVAMLIRRTPDAVFQTFVDPAITTKFWFTTSTGALTEGAKVRWDWEMYGAGTTVDVKHVEHNRRIVFEWNPDQPSTVEFRLTPSNDGTFVEITETDLRGSADEIVAHAIDSTGGFTNVLCAAKALLEHDVLLRVVEDHDPANAAAR